MTKKNTELESGKIKISEDVYATIVTMAALETKGIHIPDVALRLQELIKTALVSYTEIEVQTIDVVVQDIVFDDLVTPSQP